MHMTTWVYSLGISYLYIKSFFIKYKLKMILVLCSIIQILEIYIIYTLELSYYKTKAKIIDVKYSISKAIEVISKLEKDISTLKIQKEILSDSYEETLTVLLYSVAFLGGVLLGIYLFNSYFDPFSGGGNDGGDSGPTNSFSKNSFEISLDPSDLKYNDIRIDKACQPDFLNSYGSSGSYQASEALDSTIELQNKNYLTKLELREQDTKILESLNKVQENLFTISKEFISVETQILSDNTHPIQSLKKYITTLDKADKLLLETIPCIHESLNSLLIIIKSFTY